MTDYLQVLIPIIALFVNVIGQVLLVRAGGGLLKSVFAGAFLGVVGLAALELYLFKATGQGAADLIAFGFTNIFIYGALSYCYFHFVNLGETARRIRIMREIYESGDGLTMDELVSRYGAREIMEKRFGRLINSGQVELKAGRYVIKNPTLLLMSKAMQAAKVIILGKKSEFD